MTTLLYAVLLLAATGLIAAVVLYFIAMKFKVEEDPRIDLVTERLPGANCGACGKAGCRDLAKFLVESQGGTDTVCPVCSNEEWAAVAELLGLHADTCEIKIPVIRCQGGHLNSFRQIAYEGFESCAYAHSLHAGENGCRFGCLGQGDCVRACPFGCLHLNPETGLPEVNEAICTACGACTKACPRGIIELRYKHAHEGRIYVACHTEDKGAVAIKHCKSACIGCGKCAKTCPVGAIKVDNNLAYIDFTLCTHCGSCVAVCPTHAIVSTQPSEPDIPHGAQTEAPAAQADTIAAATQTQATAPEPLKTTASGQTAPAATAAQP